MNAEERFYTVKELCAKYQITRKTLFYYDRTGLLKPAGRVGTQQHKVYDSKAVETLEKVLLYRSAGMTIQETRIMVSGSITSEQEIAKFLDGIRQRLFLEKEDKEKEIANLEKIMAQFPVRKE